MIKLFYTVQFISEELIMLKNISFCSEDTRVRKYMLPQKILFTTGIVKNEELLLKERAIQVNTVEPNVTYMKTTDTEHAGILLDFGVEFQGSAVLGIHRIKSLSGEGMTQACMRLSFGESANEALSHIGEKGACNDHSPRDFETPIVNYSTVTLGNTGYRFLYLELLTPGVVSLACVQGLFEYQPYEYIGSFSCNDALLNRIYDTAVYTCHLCIQNELWDGIKRDRLIWIGDLAPEMKTIKYVFGEIPQIYQALETSANVAPIPQWINKIATYSLWWLINLQEWSFYTGKTSYLDEQKDYITDLTHLVLNSLDEHGYFEPSSFIDWPSKSFEEATHATKALYLMAMDACIQMHTYFHNDELVELCKKSAASLADSKESCGNFKQVAALLLLNNIADENAAKLLASGGAKGFSTFMSYYILSAMAKCCSTDDTLAALKEYYGAMLDLGATTFWEDFDLDWVDEHVCRLDEIYKEGQNDIHGDHGAYCYKGFRHSFCHGWASGPVAFLTEHVLGVDITGEGCSEITIKPNLGSLTFANGSIATPYGKVEIAHTRLEDGSIHTEVQAPEQVTIVIA